LLIFEIFKDKLFAVVRIVNLENIARRTHDLQRHRDEYIMQDLNQIWFVDEYLKLKSFDIEIYDEINVYFRYISWIYVDIFARTKINVYRQYLNIIDDLHYMSVIIRFDRETKTILMTQAHFELICNVFNVRTNLFVKKRQVIFKQCYYYEISTFNQRIEAWWKQLNKEQLSRWRVNLSLSYEIFKVNNVIKLFSLLKKCKSVRQKQCRWLHCFVCDIHVHHS
jgi:hypothetical protein